jgi:hypothetical protein
MRPATSAGTRDGEGGEGCGGEARPFGSSSGWGSGWGLGSGMHLSTISLSSGCIARREACSPPSSPLNFAQ